MRETSMSLRYLGYPRVKLPADYALPGLSLVGSIKGRRSALEMPKVPLPLSELSLLLDYSCGILTEGTEHTRPLRASPSAGAMFPEEIFIYAQEITGLEKAVFHFELEERELARICSDVEAKILSTAFAQSELFSNCSAAIFICGCFDRVVRKYGERGYRFALIEAGHIAQNLCLLASALERKATPVGGYYDRIVDRLLDLDGINVSTIYTVLIG
jgi:SagB-type dehydrogenase family enzyme